MDVLLARKIGEVYKLAAPKEYWELPIADLEKIIGKGGCGPGKAGDYIIPDTIYGLNIKPACTIHDFQYSIMMNEIDREKADTCFLLNMRRMIFRYSKGRIMRFLRVRRAKKYYYAVHIGGKLPDKPKKGG